MEVIEAEHRTKTVGEEACVFCFNSVFFMGSCFVLQFCFVYLCTIQNYFCTIYNLFIVNITCILFNFTNCIRLYLLHLGTETNTI
jgi:hypothetical protein